jgi:hypothetical protein
MNALPATCVAGGLDGDVPSYSASHPTGELLVFQASRVAGLSAVSHALSLFRQRVDRASAPRSYVSAPVSVSLLERMKTLSERRAQLMAMRASEQRRLREASSPLVEKTIRAMLESIETQIRAVENELV